MDFSINLNIKHVNGMTHFDLAMKLVKCTHGYNILHKLLTPHDREYIFFRKLYRNTSLLFTAKYPFESSFPFVTTTQSCLPQHIATKLFFPI